MSDKATAEDYSDIPASMRDAQRWLVWKSVGNRDPTKKNLKVPFYVNGMTRAETDTERDRGNLSTFDNALRTLSSGAYTGLAFALGPDGTGNFWQGIDLDDLAARADLRILADDGLPGYTETSPSGNGVHAIGYGLPFAAMGSNSTGIEAYSAGRFFTVTGDGAGIGQPVCLADYVERILRPKHGVFTNPLTQRSEASESASHQQVSELRSALSSMRADDRDLWIANGQRLKKLGDVGRGLWLEWSQQSDKFDPTDAARVWDSLSGDKTGFVAVFAEAQRRGWTNPMSAEAALAAGRIVAGRAANDAAMAKPVVAFTHIGDIELKPTDWLVQDWVVAGSLAGLVAPSGAGKSFLAIEWSCCVATGTPWGEREVKQGAVFYLAGEGQSGLLKRVKGWANNRKADVSWSPLYISDQLPPLHEPDMAANVIAVIQAMVDRTKQTPVLIVIDTVARAMGGANENSSDDMGRLIRAMDALKHAWGACVLSVHHTGLAEGTQERARGSSAYRAALDSEFIIRPGDPDITLKCTKAKDWKTPDELTLTKEVVGIALPMKDGKILRDTTLVLNDVAGTMSAAMKKEKVRAMKRAGASNREIERRTGVSEKTVRRWSAEADEPEAA